jgi:hypothetical protein
MNKHGSPVLLWALALSCSAMVAPRLAAQDLPALALTMELAPAPGETVPMQPGQPIPVLGHIRVKVHAPATAAGTWCIPLLEFHLTSQSFLNNPPMAWAAALTAPTCTVADLLPPNMAWQGPCLGEAVTGRNDGGYWLTQAIGANPDEPLHAEPLFSTLDGEIPIAQDYGLNPPPMWVDDEIEMDFSLDKLMQHAAWDRLQALPDFPYTSQETFFNSRDWTKLLDAHPTLSILMVGLRAPNVNPRTVPAAGGDVEGLTQWPNWVPRITIAPQWPITFVDTGLNGGVNFWSAWAGPIYPIHIVAPGGDVVVPAAGFRPGMQLALVKSTNNTRLEVDARWAGFGQVRIPVPANAAPGNYDVLEFRYRTYVGGVPGWGPWQALASGYRPRLLVQ